MIIFLLTYNVIGQLLCVDSSWLKLHAKKDVELVFINRFILCVQVAAHGEGPVEAAAGTGQRTVGQQQSFWSRQNSRRDLTYLGETGKTKRFQAIDTINNVTDVETVDLSFRDYCNMG